MFRVLFFVGGDKWILKFKIEIFVWIVDKYTSKTSSFAGEGLLV